MSFGSAVVTSRVYGAGPFIEVGDPTAVAVSSNLVAVGGSLGTVQWNGRSAYDRSDRSVGWFPVGLYNAQDLDCLRVLSSRWEINSIAVHPSGRLVAIGTGAYDGGYAFEGELLIHDLDNGRTVSVLNSLRSVEGVTWHDEYTLELLLAPPTDEDVLDWKDLQYEFIRVGHDDWSGLGRRGIDVDAQSRTHVAPPSRDAETPRRVLAGLAADRGLTWTRRRLAWAISSTPVGGVILGLESRIEHWHEGTSPTWHIDIDGTCTQLFPIVDGGVIATVWTNPESSFLSRPAMALTIAPDSGDYEEFAQPGHPAILVSRRDGCFLIRDTQHGPRAGHPSLVIGPDGETLGQVDLSAYDLFNHFFDVRRAQDFLVLVGEDPRAHENKWVASVSRSLMGKWKLQRLFPLAWKEGAHLLGGPGIYVEDATGKGVVHSGMIHDGQGLLLGNAFVARRRLPDGRVEWRVPLDNQVTALDECGGRIVAVTNLGELVGMDAASGAILFRENDLTVGGHRVIPLSLTMATPYQAWIGTLDGRAVQVDFAPGT